jgi:hypothetical protein
VLALALVVLGLASPPKAYVEPGNAPLAVSSWCWGAHCGAPISASTRTTTVRRGTTLRVELAFTPVSARVAVGGQPVHLVKRGRELSWQAGKAGGLTISVSAAKGFVVYVGRVVVR